MKKKGKHGRIFFFRWLWLIYVGDMHFVFLEFHAANAHGVYSGRDIKSSGVTQIRNKI